MPRSFRANTASRPKPPGASICSIEKVARLQLYVQDIKAGRNQILWEVARSNITSYSPTDFGLVRVMDNKITAEPDYNSEEVGRAQAIIAFTDIQEMAINYELQFLSCWVSDLLLVSPIRPTELGSGRLLDRHNTGI
ncbi:hypothetical protein ACS0TY_003293 [Phlomoides rotata]